MRGPKIALARQTALVFGEAMSKLGVATSILGFSTGQNGVAREAVRESGQTQHDLSEQFRLEPLLHVVFKTFGEKFERISGRLEHMDVHRLTPLGESMLWAARALAARPEERKILFVLTDGRPAVGLGDEDITFRHAQRSILRIEHAGIDVALVGIQDASVLSLHPHSVVVHRLDELPAPSSPNCANSSSDATARSTATHPPRTRHDSVHRHSVNRSTQLNSHPRLFCA